MLLLVIVLRVLILVFVSTALVAMESDVPTTEGEHRNWISKLRAMLPIAKHIEPVYQFTEFGLDSEAQAFLEHIPKDYKRDVSSKLACIDPEKRFTIYAQFQTRKKASLEKEKMDQLLLALNTQMIESNANARQQLALQREQLLSAEKSRMTALRTASIASLVTCISIGGNLYQFFANR